MANRITFQVVTLRLTGLKGRVAIIPGTAQAWRRISLASAEYELSLVLACHGLTMSSNAALSLITRFDPLS